MDKNKTDAGFEMLLSRALARSDIPWWEWHIPSNRVTANDYKILMLGYDPQEFSGATYQAFTKLLHPGDIDRAMQAMRDHLEGRAPLYQVDYRIQRADTTYTWYMDRGRIVERTEKGRPVRLRGVVLDLGPSFSGTVYNEEVVSLIRSKLPFTETGEQVFTMCSSCKKVRIQDDMWIAVDPTFEDGLKGRISHGFCHSCIEALFPDLASEILHK